eukprot:scaffold917_cov217-Pinguiococcus_pyrenoidosus.AAC.2
MDIRLALLVQGPPIVPSCYTLNGRSGLNDNDLHQGGGGGKYTFTNMDVVQEVEGGLVRKVGRGA